MAESTLMLQQYRRLKSRFPDAILLFRLGDFYEMFEDDARVVSRQLGLVLTSRRFSERVRLAMCGVPYRQLTPYVAKLLVLGHKVAIADQLEDARQAKRLIHRDVVRVITPGTVVEEALLADKAQNYLVALAPGRPAHLPRASEAGDSSAEPQSLGGSIAQRAGWGLAAVDLSTGEFVTAQFDGPEAWPQVLEELNVLQPSEIILPAEMIDDEACRAGLSGMHNTPARLSPVDAAGYDLVQARERLLRHLGALSLEPFGCHDLPLATAAAGAALHYLQANQLAGLAHLRTLETWRPESSLGLDAVTRRNLELTSTLHDPRVRGSLLGVLDCTATSMGARLLRRWIQQPLVDLKRIDERLDAIEELCPQPHVKREDVKREDVKREDVKRENVKREDVKRENARRNTEESSESRFTLHVSTAESSSASPGPPSESRVTLHTSQVFLRIDLRTLFDGLYDMERIVGRIGIGTANARDLAALRRTLERLPHIKSLLAAAQSARLRTLHDDLDELNDVAALISAALIDSPPILLREGGLIRPGYHEELNRLRRLAAEGREWLAGYEAQERERTGIPNLRVRYNQVFGFFVEVPRSKSSLVPAEYERRATISHAERYVTPELRIREAEIVAAEDRANELEYDLFVDLRQQVAAHSDRLRRSARVLAELDVLAALAEVAAQHGYTRPIVDHSTALEIVEGRHPVVEQLLPEGVRFIPNDLALDGETQRLLVITGPNMSGKSVVCRQAALLVLLAQMGSFVPARSARIGLVDRLFVRAGASDDIAQGRSTFLVEMNETAHILRHATARSLVVLDEVGRGTSTYDGMALAWAVGEDLHDRVGARTLFATHFHELTALAEGLDAARNFSMAASEQGHDVVFLYKLVEGGADRSYGVQVARLAGVPEHVVARAREVMERLEKGKEEGGGRKEESEERGVMNDKLTEREKEEGHRSGGRKDESEERGVKSDEYERGARGLREVEPGYQVGVTVERMLVGADDAAVWDVVREVVRVDVANLTPVHALVLLNDLQQRLRADR